MRGAADQVKRVSLELGGHAPLIVFPDADPEMVAKAAVIGKFRNRQVGGAHQANININCVVTTQPYHLPVL